MWYGFVAPCYWYQYMGDGFVYSTSIDRGQFTFRLNAPIQLHNLEAYKNVKQGSLHSHNCLQEAEKNEERSLPQQSIRLNQQGNLQH